MADNDIPQAAPAVTPEPDVPAAPPAPAPEPRATVPAVNSRSWWETALLILGGLLAAAAILGLLWWSIFTAAPWAWNHVFLPFGNTVAVGWVNLTRGHPGSVVSNTWNYNNHGNDNRVFGDNNNVANANGEKSAAAAGRSNANTGCQKGNFSTGDGNRQSIKCGKCGSHKHATHPKAKAKAKKPAPKPAPKPCPTPTPTPVPPTGCSESNHDSSGSTADTEAKTVDTTGGAGQE